MHHAIDYWIEQLELIPHPEGGFFREVYRSNEKIPHCALPKRYSGERTFFTMIYFLLPGNHFSAFHRIQSDECWHFYSGTRLTLCIIRDDGVFETRQLGSNPEKGDSFQTVIKAGCWFGGYVEDPKSFALSGCTVAPGFEFSDFEIASRKQLLDLYPEHKDIIIKLTN